VLWKPLISECSPKDWLLSCLLLMTMHAPQHNPMTLVDHNRYAA